MSRRTVFIAIVFSVVAITSCGTSDDGELTEDNGQEPAVASAIPQTMPVATPASGTQVSLEEWQANVLTEREALRKEPVPEACPVTGWHGPDPRLIYEGHDYAYWIEGSGMMLGEEHGTLVAGSNRVSWLVEPGVSADDSVTGKIALNGAQLDGDEPEGKLKHSVIEQIPILRGVRVSGIERAWIAELEVPTSGCWQLEASIGSHQFEAIVYVF